MDILTQRPDNLPDRPIVPDDGPEPVTGDERLLASKGMLGMMRLIARWMDGCRDAGLTFGPGRGSAVASPTLRSLNVVCAGLPDCDPRRFMTDGDKWPDVDVDVAASQRRVAVERLRRDMPLDWTVTPGRDGQGRVSPCALFLLPVKLASWPDRVEMGVLEAAGWPRLDLLASVELDAIRLAAALDANPRLLESLSLFSRLTWLPMHRFAPAVALDWTPAATQEDWGWLNRCPKAFFQLRQRGRVRAPKGFEDAMRLIASMRPGRGYTYQEEAMAELTDRGVCSWDQADMLRHPDRHPDLAARVRADGRCPEAVDYLASSYGYSRAHAAGYAAVLDMEARLASRHPRLWATALYDTDAARNPKVFDDPRGLAALTGPWAPDPALGARFGGVAHLKGFGPVNAHAIQDSLVDYAESCRISVPRPRIDPWWADRLSLAMLKSDAQGAATALRHLGFRKDDLVIPMELWRRLERAGVLPADVDLNEDQGF